MLGRADFNRLAKGCHKIGYRGLAFKNHTVRELGEHRYVTTELQRIAETLFPMNDKGVDAALIVRNGP